MTATLTIGRYHLLRELGRSNNVVYEAEDSATGRRVALKVMELPATLLGAERAQRVERFQREARAALRMSHANIVQTYETGQDKGRLFVAMEFLEGKPLARVLREEGKLSLERATAILQQMCAALTYAHSRGVVHRDVKPSNAMLLPDGRVKVTDFGIARIRSDPRMTVEGQTLGTPYYMSPEQVRGQDVTSASDIFSCGVVFYEMVTGKKPFEGSNIAEIGLKIVEEEPDYPEEVPRPLVGVLRKALAKYPAARFATAEEFAHAVLHPPSAAEVASAAVTCQAAPVSPAPVVARPDDWTPEQSEVAWRRARAAAVAIAMLILGLSLPSILREHSEARAVKEMQRDLAAAVAAAEMGRWEEALESSENSLNATREGSRTFGKAWEVWRKIRLDYAQWLLEAGRPWEAIRWAREVVERGGLEPEAHLVMGKAYLVLGERESARRELQACVGRGGAAAWEAEELLASLGVG